MMKKTITKKSTGYTIDLTKIDGDGAFPCPRCGSVISPDDTTDETYTVEPKVENDQVTELAIVCKKCGTTIRLVGFDFQPEA